MAAQVTSLPLIRLPAAPSAATPDQRYWSGFSTEQLIPALNSSPVTHISSNTASIPNSHTSAVPPTSYIAVTTGPRLQLFSPQTLKLVRTIARTQSPFHSATVRNDGRVVLAGSDAGAIHAFDTSSRAILKSWKEHQQPVWVTNWHPKDPTSLMSCSDDTTVRLWDLPSDESAWTGYGHTDYVRSGAFIGDAHLIATGSYDRSIRIWDTRISSSGSHSCVMNFKLASPVEAVLPMPTGTTLLGASGEKLVVLDLVAARPLNILHNHQKTITSLSLASHGQKVVTGSLDGHIKIFDAATWTVVAGHKYPSPILSLAVIPTGSSKEDRHIAVGMQSGLLSIRSRLSSTAKAAKRLRDKELDALASGEIDSFDASQAKKARKKAQASGLGWSARIRGKDFTGEAADIVIDPKALASKKTGALRLPKTPWEHALRRAQYATALDLALATHDKTTILTLLTALNHREALHTALQGRNVAGLLPVLRWLTKNVADPRCVRLTTYVAEVLVSEYAGQAGQSGEVDEGFERLHEEVRRGAEMCQMAVGTVGMLEFLGGVGS